MLIPLRIWTLTHGLPPDSAVKSPHKGPVHHVAWASCMAALFPSAQKPAKEIGAALVPHQCLDEAMLEGIGAFARIEGRQLFMSSQR